MKNNSGIWLGLVFELFLTVYSAFRAYQAFRDERWLGLVIWLVIMVAWGVTAYRIGRRLRP